MRALNARLAKPLPTLEFRLGAAVDLGVDVWVAPTEDELAAALGDAAHAPAPGPRLFLGEVVGSVLEPDLRVCLGSPSLFAHAGSGPRVIHLREPQAEVAHVIARRLDSTRG